MSCTTLASSQGYSDFMLLEFSLVEPSQSPLEPSNRADTGVLDEPS